MPTDKHPLLEDPIVKDKALKIRITDPDAAAAPDSRSTFARMPRGADSTIFKGWGVKI